MIKLYAWHTPNGRKVSVMLEEVGLPYEIVKVDLGRREQFSSGFTAISPNQKIPAIVDGDQWLMFQMAHIGPMLGQAHHFRLQAKEKLPYAIARYEDEASRLFTVLDTQLGKADFLAGDYSIADIATYPWIMRYFNFGVRLEDYPALKRWTDRIGERPAVQRGMEALKPLN